MLDAADAVTCASPFIRDRVATRHPRAHYVPDSIDAAHFAGRKTWSRRAGPLRAIWSGTSVKAHELLPALRLLGDAGYRTTLLTDADPGLGVCCDIRRWAHASFPSDILEGDVAISYRASADSYDAGHSAFKLAVMMFQGVPALASPLPSYEALLADGGGLVCRDDRSWRSALESIAAESVGAGDVERCRTESGGAIRDRPRGARLRRSVRVALRLLTGDATS